MSPIDVMAVSVVALRKESVDRNCGTSIGLTYDGVALRKESVDRNCMMGMIWRLRMGRSP